jgi:hypothetical protein
MACMRVDLCVRAWRATQGVVVAALVVGVALTIMSSSAMAHTSASPPVVLRPHFTPVRSQGFLASGRYAFVRSPIDSRYSGVVIDQRTGRRTRLSFPGGCSAETLGGPYIALQCLDAAGFPVSPQLYDMRTRTTSSVTASSSLQAAYGCPVSITDPGCLGEITAIGTHWLSVGATDASTPNPETVYFQNLTTGQVLADPATAMTNINLNSPALAERACAPLSIPTVQTYLGARPGSLTAGGRFEIAAGQGGVYLERCGSHLHEFLTSTLEPPGYTDGLAACAAFACPPAHNARMVIWQAPHSRLSGIFLPSRRRFTIPIPRAVNLTSVAHPRYTLALTNTTLYLNPRLSGDKIWSTPAPRPPR